MSEFTDEYSRNKSHRLALAFRYANSDLSFSDRGFKNIYRIVLEVSLVNGTAAVTPSFAYF